MAFTGFNVGWSPVQKRQSQVRENVEIIECKLAPFASIAKVNFPRVQVGSTASQTIVVKNPGRERVSAKLIITADFTAAGFHVSAEDMMVDPGQEFELIVTWRPIQSGTYCFTLSMTTNLPRVKSAVQISGSAAVSKNSKNIARKMQRASSALKENTYNILPSASSAAVPSPSTDRKTFTIESFEGVLPKQFLPIVEDAMPLDLSKRCLSESGNASGVVQGKENVNVSSASPKKSSDLEMSFGHNFEQLLLKNLSDDRECLMSVENLRVPNPCFAYSSTPVRLNQLLGGPMDRTFTPTPVKPEPRSPPSAAGASRHLLFEISPPKTSHNLGIVRKVKNDDGVKHQITVHSLSPKSIQLFKKPQTPRVQKNVIAPSVTDLYNETNSQRLNELIAWLNSLLSPLRELTNETTDVTVAWQEVTRHDNNTSNLSVARDEACRVFHIADSERRGTLVKAASAMYCSEDVRGVLMKLKSKIQSGFLEMKDDRDVLYDSGDRIKLTNIIMKYSPIWLTICLEAMFGKSVTPSGNGWRSSLVNFINSNLLDDKRSASKSQFYTKYRTQAFKKKMNENIIIKFISLVFFLDLAKKRRLIPFDPCLFNINSNIKDSEALLNEFIREFIKCATRMKQTFNSMGLCLKYKQSVLDEYDMQVTSHLDLRDGVRLARLLEIIFKGGALSEKLRVPPVSRLQKIHNVKVVLSALQQQGITISEDITPGDVVDGHREKITSLVWQILHKFLLPKKEAAAKVVQRWWRSLPVRLKVKIKNKYQLAAEARQSKAAIKIQSWWRGTVLRRQWEVIKAPLVQHRRQRLASIKIQRWYRTCRGRLARQAFLEKRWAVLKIQNWYRSILKARQDRHRFLRLRKASVYLQIMFRARRAARAIQFDYLRTRSAAITIQRWYRSVICRKQFLKLKSAALTIQTQYRLRRLGRATVLEYSLKRTAVVTIQRWVRARKQRQIYLRLRNTVCDLQRRFRARLAGRALRHEFLRVKSATVTIQRWYLAQKSRKDFLNLRKTVLAVQSRFRSQQIVRKARQEFIKKREAVKKIQTWYRSLKSGRKTREQYLRTKYFTIQIQRKFRARALGRSQRSEYLQLRSSAVILQRWYRSQQIVRKARQEFIKKREAAKKIQNWYRSLKSGRQTREQYLRTKYFTIQIQRKFRARALGRSQRSEYLQLRSSAVILQTWYRSRRARRRFLEMKSAALVIQKRFRDRLACRAAIAELQGKREAASRIRQMFASRDNLNVPDELTPPALSDLVRSVVVIQRWFRRVMLTREARRELDKRRMKSKALQSKGKNHHGKLARSSESTHFHHDDGFICPCRAQTKRRKAASKTLRDKFNSSVEIISSRNRDINDIWLCFKDLDFVTEHSSALCEELADQAGSLRFIWAAINKETRAERQQDIICYGFNIFINLTLYGRTRDSIWQAFLDNDGCGTVLSIMGKYVTKPTPIFCKAATFLWLVIHNDRSHSQYVKNYHGCQKTLAFYLKKVSPATTTDLSSSNLATLPRSSSRIGESFSTPSSSSQLAPSSTPYRPPIFKHNWGYGGSSVTKEFLSKKTALMCLNSYLRFSSLV